MRTTRNLAAAVSLATGVLLAGCTPGDTGGSEQDAAPSDKPEQQNALADFDPCKAFSKDELSQLGVEEPGEFVDQGVGEKTCEFDTEEDLIAVSKSPGDDLSYWQNQGDKFAKFERNSIGSHDGASAVTKSAQGTGMCRQFIEAGDSSVDVQITSSSSDADDSAACSKAMEIAEQIEPKLPA